MGATGTKLDRKAAVEAQALSIVHRLLTELGDSRGLEELAARRAAAHLERELGLGSLERVELILRLDEECGVRLSDRVVAEADTVQDLIDAVLRADSDAPPSGAPAAAASAGVRAAYSSPSSGAATAAAVATSPSARLDLEEQIRRAETLTEILRLRGRAEPGRVHIQLYEEGDQLRTITFGDLYERASAVAVHLRRRGLEPAQAVAIMLPTCAEFFYTFAGILLAGGIPVPIYPPFRADRIAEYAARQSKILRNAEAQFLITVREARGLARLLQPRVPSLREVFTAEQLTVSPPQGASNGTSAEWRPVEHLSHRARADEIAFLQYTSGSTGDPKGVILTHQNLLANIRAIVTGVELRSDDICASWLPLYHDMGLIGAWFVPLVTAIPLILMSPLAFLSRPERWLRAIERHGATISPAPNFAYELCVRKIPEKDLQGLNLSSWRAALNGAEPVNPQTMERFAARFAPYGFRREALAPVYGLAEATLAVAFPRFAAGYKVDRIQREAFESEGRAVPAQAGDPSPLEFVFAGKPLSNLELRIVDAEGRTLGERQQGSLWLRGPSATAGYYRNEAATKEILHEGGWLDTGDYAYIADGELYITGRAKDIIIKGGRNIYPHEVEEVAGRVAGVRTGCVVAFGAPDARSGTERLVVAAEVRDRKDSQRIASEISRAVDEAMGLPPDLVELLAPGSIPKTSSGKLRRSETRRLYLEGKLGAKADSPWLQIAKLAARGAVPRGWALAKHGVRRGAEAIYGAYALSVFAVGLVPLWFLVSSTSSWRRASDFTHRAARGILFLVGIPIRVEGGELLGERRASGPWIFAPNHSSYVDILVMLASLPPDVRFVAKGEIHSMPLVGHIAGRSGHFAFDRNDPRARVRQAEEVNAGLKRGESMAIYPEGTFTAATGIRPFQLGAFKAAVESQRPICPVAIRGARQILRDNTLLPRPGKVTVTFGPLVTPQSAPSDDWHEIVRLRDATREIIARNSGETLL